MRLAKGKGKGRSGGRAAPEKGKGKGTSKGKSKEAHELKSCDTGTLRNRADVPLNARRGARVDTSPHTTGPQRVYEPGGRSWTDTDTDMSVRTDLDWSLCMEWNHSRGCSDADTEWISSRGETTHSTLNAQVTEVCNNHAYLAL